MKTCVWRIAGLLSGLLLLSASYAAAPNGYYQNAVGKKSYALKTALHNIIKGHSVVSYSGLWTAFETTDKRADGKVWDMYSSIDFDFGSDQCGNYSKEGDCYNREHSFPKSWFNDATPMYSDLFHLYPTDGKVNGMRSNWPFAEVSDATYTSTNGCKLGKSVTAGYSGTGFEPADEYKGDFARTYFYMATRYEDVFKNWDCPVCGGNNQASFKTWVVDLLLKWHRADPVSQKETDRNDAVYAKQKNRNPFIDYPELVEKIWGNDNTAFDPDNQGGGDDPVDPDDPDTNQPVRREIVEDFIFSMQPNPSTGQFVIETESENNLVEIFSIKGDLVLRREGMSRRFETTLRRSGVYFVRVTNAKGGAVKRLVIR